MAPVKVEVERIRHASFWMALVDRGEDGVGQRLVHGGDLDEVSRELSREAIAAISGMTTCCPMHANHRPHRPSGDQAQPNCESRASSIPK